MKRRAKAKVCRRESVGAMAKTMEVREKGGKKRGAGVTAKAMKVCACKEKK